MALFQLSIANTFQQLYTAVSGLIGIINYLADGPKLFANTELRLTKAGTTLNVSGNLIANTLTISGSLTIPSVTTNTLTLSGNLTTNGMNISTQLIANTVLPSTLTIQSGLTNLNSATITTGNITSIHVTDANVIGGGQLTINTMNVASLNTTSGTMNLVSMNAQTGNITTVSANIANTIITSLAANISNCNISNTTFINSTLTGITKSSIGLANVDNTSDATKNSAIANLTNKTLNAPLIIGGNVSTDPTLPLQISSLNYANTFQYLDNPIINGNMDVWQRGNTFLSVANNTYTADRWKLSSNTTATIKISRSNSVPSLANAGLIFNYSLEANVTTGESGSIQSSEYAAITQRIEGFNWRPFAQTQITLSFWAYTTRPGVYWVALENEGVDRTLVSEYTINTANTWEQKTITISSSPSTGTWNYANGAGLTIHWTLGAGSTFSSGSPDTWLVTGRALKTANANGIAIIDNTAGQFRLTGVSLMRGTGTRTYPPRPFARELDLCKRYYQKSFMYHITPNTNIGTLTGEFLFPSRVGASVTVKSDLFRFLPTLRDTPSITLYNPAGNNAQVRNLTRNQDCSSSSPPISGQSGFFIQALSSASTAAADAMGVHWTATAEL